MGKAPQSPGASIASASLSISSYPASQAQEDTSFQVDDIEDLATSRNQIVEFLQTASQALRLRRIHLRQSSGPIPPNHANWQTLRSELISAGYVVQGGSVEIVWS